jgi:hypothetical protein
VAAAVVVVAVVVLGGGGADDAPGGSPDWTDEYAADQTAALVEWCTQRLAESPPPPASSVVLMVDDVLTSPPSAAARYAAAAVVDALADEAVAAAATWNNPRDAAVAEFLFGVDEAVAAATPPSGPTPGSAEWFDASIASSDGVVSALVDVTTGRPYGPPTRTAALFDAARNLAAATPRAPQESGAARAAASWASPGWSEVADLVASSTTTPPSAAAVALAERVVDDAVDAAVRPGWTRDHVRDCLRDAGLNPLDSVVSDLARLRGWSRPRAYAFVWALEPAWCDSLAVGADRFDLRGDSRRVAYCLENLARSDLSKPVAHDVSFQKVVKRAIGKGLVLSYDAIDQVYRAGGDDAVGAVQRQLGAVPKKDLYEVVARGIKLAEASGSAVTPDEVLRRYVKWFADAVVRSPR